MFSKKKRKRVQLHVLNTIVKDTRIFIKKEYCPTKNSMSSHHKYTYINVFCLQIYNTYITPLIPKFYKLY